MDNAPTRRAELLDAIVGELLAHGVADLSLRPLAERVGTSARLLIYHFETKENLLTYALTEVRARAEVALSAQFARERPKSLKAVLLMFWDWATETSNQRYFRLLFEVDGLSMFNHLPMSDNERQNGGSVWLAMIERAAAAVGHGNDDVSGNATLIMAALSGLLQDFLSTGDRERTTAALTHLIALIPSEGVAQRREPSRKKA